MSTVTPARHSHCSYCGERFSAESWPRHCARCGSLTWRNPLPVVVLIQPVDDGVLAVRRGINPGKGGVTLPGGFLETGEPWRDALARELAEETGVTIDPAGIDIFLVETSYRETSPTAPPDGAVLIFGVAPPLSAAQLPPFTPNRETLERLILTGPVELAFSTHTTALRRYFALRHKPT